MPEDADKCPKCGDEMIEYFDIPHCDDCGLWLYPSGALSSAGPANYVAWVEELWTLTNA